jgi:hypothetical protein
MGMIGYFVAGPLMACMKVVDCGDPSSVRTLTHITSIKHVCECVLPPTPGSLQ